MCSIKKKVLIITQCFPPHGGSGVQRPLFFSKYLSELGWKCIVLTTAEDDYFVHDPTLTQHIHPTTTVIRIKDPRADEKLYVWCKKTDRKIANIFSKLPILWKVNNIASKSTRTILRPIINLLSIPDALISALPKFLWQGYRILKSEHPDIILSTSPPPTMHLVACILSALTRKPWVADLRDEWTLNPFMQYPGRLYKKLDEILENITLNYADKIIATTPEIAMDTAKNAKLDLSKFEVITNGHTLDIDISSLSKSACLSKNTLNFTHAGTLLRDRSPLVWLNPFSAAFANNKEMCFNIIGDTRNFDDIIISYPWINNYGYLPHLETLNFLISSNVLVLICGNLHKRCYPGKIFEYLATGKPILAICPKNSAIWRFLQNKDCCYLADINNPESIKDQILTIYNLWKQNDLPFFIKRPEAECFHRRELTKKLDEILKTTLDFNY